MSSAEIYVVLSDKTLQGLSKKISTVTSAMKSRADMTMRQEKAALPLAWRAADARLVLRRDCRQGLSR